MLKKRRACEQLRGATGGGCRSKAWAAAAREAEAQEAAAQAEGAWEAWVGSGSRLQEGESCAA